MPSTRRRIIRSFSYAATWVGLFAVVMLAGGCGSGDQPLSQVDPAAAPATPTFEQVDAIIKRDCVPCHSGAVSPRLDSCEDVVDQADDIAETVLEENSMPPGAWPRLTSAQKLTIERWINQGAQAPCP